MDQSTTTDKNIDLYCLKFCDLCNQYIVDAEELSKKYKFKYTLHYIEDDPINCYIALLEARHSGAFIKYAPFLCIRADDKYKAVPGILKYKQLETLLKTYG